MKLISWNVNGIRSFQKKKTSLEDDTEVNLLSHFLELHNPHVFCMQETKLNSNTVEKDKLRLEQIAPKYAYRFYSTSTARKGYSGVSIWSKVKPVQVLDSHIGSSADNEGRVLALEFDKLVLVTVYTPNSGQQLKRLKFRESDWDPMFKKYIKKLMSGSKPVVVCGDLNCAHQSIDLVDGHKKTKIAGYTHEERTGFTALLSETGLQDTYRKRNPKKAQYTYWSYRTRARERGIGWRIDYFLTDPRIKFRSPKIHDMIYGSDHAPIEVTI